MDWDIFSWFGEGSAVSMVTLTTPLDWSPSATTEAHITSTVVDTGHKCVKGELSEPDFHLHACEGSKIVSWIATVFLLSMIVFGITKCLSSHGFRKIFDLRLTGVSFPQRPEFFVLLCSSLPLVFTVLTRPLFTPSSLEYDIFIRGWGFAQTRFFFDLFTRTASIYHMVYWAYRTPIIHGFWRIKLYKDYCVMKWKNRPKPVRKAKPQRRKSSAAANKDSHQVRRTGRTTEHGYGKKRARSKSVRGGKPGSTGTQSNADQKQQNQNWSGDQQPANVINAGGINLIAPQPLFPGQANVVGMMTVPPNAPMIAYNQNMLNYPNMNMFNPAMGMQPSAFGMGMGYDMSIPIGAMQPGMVPPGFPQSTSMYAFNQNPNDAIGGGDRTQKTDVPAEPAKPLIPYRPPTRAFSLYCKRIIPGFIYLISFVITIPSILSFEVDPTVREFNAARCTTKCRSYFYYDLVVLVTIPMIMITVVFYHAALAKKQLNGGTKMTYRLRCYYVTFILLNIPMFVLMLTSIGFRLTRSSHRDIYGTGILIALTAYHANFALKSTVYTTSCNCICCTDACLQRFTLLNRLITYFTTPVAMKDKKALMEGTVISVSMADAKTSAN